MRRNVPQNLFDVASAWYAAPAGRTVLQAYQESEWDRNGISPAIPAKFSVTTTTGLTAYVSEQLVQDFKDRAQYLATYHIFRPEIQTHEAVVAVDPPFLA